MKNLSGGVRSDSRERVERSSIRRCPRPAPMVVSRGNPPSPRNGSVAGGAGSPFAKAGPNQVATAAPAETSRKQRRVARPGSFARTALRFPRRPRFTSTLVPHMVLPRRWVSGRPARRPRAALSSVRDPQAQGAPRNESARPATRRLANTRSGSRTGLNSVTTSPAKRGVCTNTRSASMASRSANPPR